jgi:hypothetical protein
MLVRKLFFLPEEVIMKRMNFLIGMTGISLALGMMVIGCDQDASSGGGGSDRTFPSSLEGTTWEGELPASTVAGAGYTVLRLSFYETTVTQVYGGFGVSQPLSSSGTYIFSGNTITISLGSQTKIATINGNTFSIEYGEGVIVTFKKISTSTPDPTPDPTPVDPATPSESSTLVINGCPSGSVYVCPSPYTSPTSKLDLMGATGGAVAEGNGISPYKLTSNSTGVEFQKTGRFMVIVVFIDFSEKTLEYYYLENVSFTNGSATINFSNMKTLSLSGR